MADVYNINELRVAKELLENIKGLKSDISTEDERLLQKNQQWVEMNQKKLNLINDLEGVSQKLSTAIEKAGIKIEDAFNFEKNNRKIEELKRKINSIGDENSKLSKSLTNQLDRLTEENDIFERSLQGNVKSKKELLKLLKISYDKQEELNDLNKDELTIQEKILENEKNRVKVYDKQIAKVRKVSDNLQTVGKFGKDIYEGVKKILTPWVKVNDAVGVYGRNIGMSRAGMAALEKQVLSTATQTAGKFGATGDILLKLQQNYNQEIGRSFTLTNKQQADMAAMNRVMGEGTTIAMAAGFEKFGVGMDDVGERITQMFNDSTKKGIVFSRVSKTFADNFKMAQNYTFKRGLDGLQKMAEYSTKMRLDMQSVASFAEKVQTPEGAIETSANLQVLGGPFAQFSNPMSMLYEGLNDMEALGKRMNNMVANLGRWNAQTGEVEFSSFNRQRVRAASQAMGVSYESMMENAQTNARRRAIEANLGSRYDEDLRELIMNTAQWDKKQGQWYVTDDKGQQKNINNLDNSIKSVLQQRTKSTDANIQDIAINVRGISEVFSDIKSGSEAYQAKWVSGIGNYIKGIAGNISTMPLALQTIAGIQIPLIIATMMRNGYMNVQTLKKGFGGRVNGGNLSGRGGGVSGNIGTRGNPYIHNGRPLYDAADRSATNRANATRLAKAAKWGKVGKIGGAIGGGVLSAGITAADYAQQKAFSKESGRRNEAWGGTIGAGVGGGLGGWGGAALGATIGTAIFPGVGTALGALIGGAAGALGGSALGKTVGATGGKAVDKNRIDRMDSNVQNATFNISNGAFNNGNTIEYGSGGLLKGPSHKQGGMRVMGSNISVEGGEFVVNKKATANNLELLKAINSDPVKIRATEPYGKIMNVKENRTGSVYNNAVKTPDVSIKPIDVNISGTIRLEGGGKSIDISELMKNPVFVSELTKEITKEQNIQLHGGLRKEEFKPKW